MPQLIPFAVTKGLAGVVLQDAPFIIGGVSHIAAGAVIFPTVKELGYFSVPSACVGIPRPDDAQNPQAPLTEGASIPIQVLIRAQFLIASSCCASSRSQIH